jgi:hypothetical protein
MSEASSPGRHTTKQLSCQEIGARLIIVIRAHPQMANLPDIRVTLKILSSEYQPYACGKISRKP